MAQETQSICYLRTLRVRSARLFGLACSVENGGRSERNLVPEHSNDRVCLHRGHDSDYLVRHRAGTFAQATLVRKWGRCRPQELRPPGILVSCAARAGAEAD